MAYTSKTALIDRFSVDELVQLTDRTNVGRIDDAVLNQAIADTDAEINGYLGGRYTVPVSPTPALLAALAADIARWHLHGRVIPDTVQKRYDHAIATLVAIRDGKQHLEGATELASGSAGAPQFDATPSDWSRKNRGWD